MLLSAVGCLKEGRPVEGRLLIEGRQIEQPSFVELGGRLWVSFEDRNRTFDPEGPTYDLRMVSFEDGEARTVLENIADRPAWRPQIDGRGLQYYMVDARSVASPNGGSATAVGTLVRLDPANGVVERVPDVVSYSVYPTPGTSEFLYRQLSPSSGTAELRLRTEADDRSLGPSAGSAQMMGKGKIYFITGDERTLSRIAAPGAPVEVLRNFVTRFMLSPDESRVAVQISQGGRAQSLVMKLDDRSERRLPGENPCCWMGFSGVDFLYSDGPSAGKPASFHTFNTVTGEDRVLTLPPGLSDVLSFMPRPGTSETLLFDSLGRVARYRPDIEDRPQLLDIMAVSLSYSEDGRYLLYIVPETQMPVEGRLMVQDADFREPPRQISPRGSLVQAGGFFFIPDGENRILVFWSHYGRNASDLYYANHETGEHRVVAEGISEVVVQARRVLGIVRVSQQDLVGDLVNSDLLLQREVVLAHRVSDAAFYKTHVAFVVRERIGSIRDGLWATGIEGVQGGRMLDP